MSSLSDLPSQWFSFLSLHQPYYSSTFGLAFKRPLQSRGISQLLCYYHGSLQKRAPQLFDLRNYSHIPTAHIFIIYICIDVYDMICTTLYFFRDSWSIWLYTSILPMSPTLQTTQLRCHGQSLRQGTQTYLADSVSWIKDGQRIEVIQVSWEKKGTFMFGCLSSETSHVKDRDVFFKFQVQKSQIFVSNLSLGSSLSAVETSRCLETTVGKIFEDGL